MLSGGDSAEVVVAEVSVADVDLADVSNAHVCDADTVSVVVSDAGISLLCIPWFCLTVVSFNVI